MEFYMACPFLVISIHAAREGGDVTFSLHSLSSCGFQSTPPVKAATTADLLFGWVVKFQSTPPVKAATRKLLMVFKVTNYFNPRRP